MSAVTEQMSRRGYQHADGAADVVVTYYLLLTLSVSAQVMGQFVPATPEWGLPPFTAATQSYTLMNQGALVLDVSADVSAARKVIWRGVAQARIKFDADDKRRETLIRDAVRDLVRRFPKRS
jgi:hypothetical protein